MTADRGKDIHLAMKRMIASALSALLLSGCATSINQPIVDGPVPVVDQLVPLGQPLRVAQVVVTPMRLLEDSRCPENARCAWAGRAIVETRIDGPGWRETVPLTLGEGHAIHDVTVMLSTVAPERSAEAETPAASYLFGYQVF